MARQYKPFSMIINNIPLIVYPVKDENPLEDIYDSTDGIREQLEKLYKTNPSLTKGTYHIIFVWNLECKKMTDVWIHTMEKWSGKSGPILEVKTYRELEETDDSGIASGDSIIALGREEELRRKSKSFAEYLDRSKSMPKFPEGMTPREKFQ